MVCCRVNRRVHQVASHHPSVYYFPVIESPIVFIPHFNAADLMELGSESRLNPEFNSCLLRPWTLITEITKSVIE